MIVAVTIAEVGIIIGSVASMGGLILGIIRYLHTRIDKRIAVLEVTAKKILAAAGAQVRRQIEGVDPRTFVTLDYQMDGVEQPLRIPLLFDRVITPLPGFRLQLLDHDRKRTIYSLVTLGHNAPLRLHWHYHDEEETVQVIKGRMTDVATGKVFLPGDTWTLAAGVRHTVDFDNVVCIVTVIPPLPSAHDAPATLDSIERVYDAVEPMIDDIKLQPKNA
jgi:hypothetical protein